jgi:nucleoid DNA-binding protein
LTLSQHKCVVLKLFAQFQILQRNEREARPFLTCA